MTPTITPFLWFNGQAEQAMRFYLSVFPDSEEISVQSAGDMVISVTFRVQNQEIMALNGGPDFVLNESFSLFVLCQDQEEVDRYWSALCEGGTPSRCGWLKDQFGVSWQIIPKQLGQLLSNPDPAVSGKAMQAMLGMEKIVIADLER
jgi:predicted 3-demethylubiquinone-9 3-methyltransferase (glyoxalase superfamily)